MKAIPHIGFNLTVDFIKQGKSVVAYSPALDISTVGKNRRKPRNDLLNSSHFFSRS